jgi:hypothetical protein
MSFAESLINIVVGLGVAMAANAVILPLMGFPISLHENAIIAAFMTVVSIARSFTLRRVFEALHIRRPLSPFMQAVIAERFRQIEVEGWNAEHDRQHTPREIARAGAAYLVGAERFTVTDYEADEEEVPLSGRLIWPWGLDFWKPRELRRDLVRGCALGLAAGERSDELKRKRSAS